MRLGALLGTTEVIFCGQKRSICLTAKKITQSITRNKPSNQSYSSSSLDDPVSPHNLPPIFISVTKEEYRGMEYIDRNGKYE